MKALGLTPAQQKRLEKLARDAGRTPAQAFKFVLRDGFDFCEWVLREGGKSDLSVKRHGRIPHAVAQRKARDVVAAAYARRHKRAA